MLSFAVKWAGSGTIECYALPDFPGYKRNPTDDTALTKKLWEVYNKADYIVAHNAVAFDDRKSNTFFLRNIGEPPPPTKIGDTMLTLRKHFMLNDNSLAGACKSLGCPWEKIDTGGIDLWLDCMDGDEAAWRKMIRYNKHDVRMLEWLYYKIRPWMRTHPNVSLGTGKEDLACPVCGKQDTIGPRGYRALKSYRARLYHCYKNRGGCGAWPTGKREKIQGEILSA